MLGITVVLCSFILAIIVRTIARKKEECMIAKFLPQVILIGGGLFGSYLFLLDNWQG